MLNPYILLSMLAILCTMCFQRLALTYTLISCVGLLIKLTADKIILRIPLLTYAIGGWSQYRCHLHWGFRSSDSFRPDKIIKILVPKNKLKFFQTFPISWSIIISLRLYNFYGQKHFAEQKNLRIAHLTTMLSERSEIITAALLFIGIPVNILRLVSQRLYWSLLKLSIMNSLQVSSSGLR